MKVLFAGGGTAGHINPALAIASAVRDKNPTAQIMFVGNQNSLEEKLVTAAGFPIRFIHVVGFDRKHLHRSIRTLRLFLQSVKDCEKIIREFSPNVVVGTGGYVSGPLVYAAAKLGVPTCIHEQNAYPGMTSKMLSRYVDRVFISFDSSRKFFKCSEKLVLTGNPLREDFLFVREEASRQKLGLGTDDFYAVSFAGSLGSREFNKAMTDVIVKNAQKSAFRQLHATGKFGIRWMPELLKEKGVDLQDPPKGINVKEYIYDMPEHLAAADVVICRAGAITLGEIMALGKAAILIPSPNVTHNHQYHNAMSLVQKDAALLLEEKDMTAEKLYDMILSLKEDPQKRRIMGQNARKMALLDATEVIYQSLMELCK